MPATGVELRAFVRHRGDELAAVMRTLRTQTNEVGRCAVLLPALPAGPLALIEVGASAGLVLLLDRYHYDYGVTRLGAEASPVRLHCQIDGALVPPDALPAIAWRRGLDLQPVDVRDDDARRWLSACVWSDHVERRHRLEAAMGLAREAPPTVVAGDLVDDLPALLADVPLDRQLVVFHSAVLAYVSAARRTAFADVLAAASKDRDIVWISNEAPGVVTEIPDGVPSAEGLRFVLARTRFSGGRRREDEHLGLAHPHGASLVSFAS